MTLRNLIALSLISNAIPLPNRFDTVVSLFMVPMTLKRQNIEGALTSANAVDYAPLFVRPFSFLLWQRQWSCQLSFSLRCPLITHLF